MAAIHPSSRLTSGDSKGDRHLCCGPAKASGAVSFYGCGDGTAAPLLLYIVAALKLALEVIRAFFARPFGPVAALAAFTVLAAAAEVDGAAVSATTAAKERTMVGGVGPFTAAGDATGGSTISAEGGR